jgi:hypothetical protein
VSFIKRRRDQCLEFVGHIVEGADVAAGATNDLAGAE